MGQSISLRLLMVKTSPCGTGHTKVKARHKRESKNKKQETKRFSTFAVSRLRHSETKKKILLDSRIKFLAKHV